MIRVRSDSVQPPSAMPTDVDGSEDQDLLDALIKNNRIETRSLIVLSRAIRVGWLITFIETRVPAAMIWAP